jgi:hypothetical protein
MLASGLGSSSGIRFAIAGFVARPSSTYQPRAPADRVLYQVVREHFETFRAQAAGVCDGGGLPRFVEEEFEGFLRCGFLAGGFARFQCDGCHQDVPSCFPLLCAAALTTPDLLGHHLRRPLGMYPVEEQRLIRRIPLTGEGKPAAKPRSYLLSSVHTSYRLVSDRVAVTTAMRTRGGLAAARVSDRRPPPRAPGRPPRGRVSRRCPSADSSSACGQ